MKKLFFIPLIVILAIGLIFGGCAETAVPTKPAALSEPATPTSPATPAEPAMPAETTPKYGGTLKIIRGLVPSTIGWPAEMMPGAGTNIIQVCLETLLHGDAEGNLYPWLAESYKVADDLKSITFTLRKGVKFHDGSDFNAEVAKWNLDNLINARMQANWASVDIIDDYAIRVNFTEWVNTLPASFADTAAPANMVSKAAYDQNGKKWMRANPVGTGPFKFDSFTLDVGCKFVRNPDYWVEGKPYLDGIEYIFIADPMTRKMAMETGEGDIIDELTPKETVELVASLGLTVEVVMEMTWVLIPDTANPDSPWSNKKVREAVEHAIDREGIAKAFGYGCWNPTYQIPAPYSLAYDPDFALGRQYDPEKAKQLLAEAGYPDGFKTTIIQIPDPAYNDVTAAVQAYLAKVGIEVNLDITEPNKWMTYMGPGMWPENSALYMCLPAMDVNNIGGLQFMFNMLGQSWLKTPEMTQAYQAALASPAPDFKMARVVTDMITKDASLIPINEGGAGKALMPYVMDVGFNERGNTMQWNVEEVWLDK